MVVFLIIGIFVIFSNKKKVVNEDSFSISKGEIVILEQYKMKVKLASIKNVNDNKKYIFKVTYNNFTKEYRFDSNNLNTILFDEYQMQISTIEDNDELNINISKLFG